MLFGVVVNTYYQYFSQSTPYDMHPGLIGFFVNIFIVITLSFVFSQSENEKQKSEEFNNI